MTITKKEIIDRIEIVGEFRHVQVRTATVIEEDGEELTRAFHRHVVVPDADISGENSEVQAICNVVHTQAVKQSWKDKKDKGKKG